MSIPTFTPPTAPTFTPPKHTGPCCAHHTNEPAVAKCARCGKNICQDCKDVYTVTNDQYAGKSLCYDCCQQIVGENVKALKKQTFKFGLNLLMTIIGMIIGASIFAEVGGFWVVFGMLWIGSFWLWLTSSVKAWFDGFRDGSYDGCLSVIGGFIGACIGAALVAPFHTVWKLWKYTIHLIKTSKALKGDTAALAEMRDYMAYTLVRNQNKGVDLETLMSEGSELYNNTFARRVLDNGEIEAVRGLSEAATQISETGEIIRNFRG